MMYAHSVSTNRLVVVAVVALTVVMSGHRAHAQSSVGVKSHQKISDTAGDFLGILDNEDQFSISVASLGDLDGPGTSALALAVGAHRDDDGVGSNTGAVWILFLDVTGTVTFHQKISDTEGGFTGTIDNGDFFGCSVASIGDLDGDGVVDVAVGARLDDDGGSNRGAVWILFLYMDGTVKSHQKISDTAGGFTGTLNNQDNFGVNVASLGDLNADGVVDLAVGAWGDDDGGSNNGAVWILFLDVDTADPDNPVVTVPSYHKISDTSSDLPLNSLGDEDWFGWSVAALGDLNFDGVVDLAVGAVQDNSGGPKRGAVWILFLNTNGTVGTQHKISDISTDLPPGALGDNDQFGRSVAYLGDLNCDGVGDLAVGALLDDDGGLDRGAVWLLFLNTNGTVNSHQKISDTAGNFTGILDDRDLFGTSVAALGDLDSDGVIDLAVGALLDDDGGTDRGAVWVLFLDDAKCPCEDCPWDFDGDGNVGVSDLLELLQYWGPCPKK